jgi:hypothetical protein
MGKRSRAIYFDNEDHVIQYTVTSSKDDKSLTFLSDAVAVAPRFRLTYTKKGKGLRITFENAPPGNPDAFRTYLEGSAHRKGEEEKK